MIGRKKALNKRTSKEDFSLSSFPFGKTRSSSVPLNNEKPKRNRQTNETDGKDLEKGDTKSRGPFKMKLNARRSSPNEKTKSIDVCSNGVAKQEPSIEKSVPFEKSNIVDLNEMKYPAEYVPPMPGNERRRSSAHRVSYRKAIQKAGYNMNEIATASTEKIVPSTQQKPIQKLTDVDWSENAAPDHHVWASTTASGDLCFVGEENCQKSGPRIKCDICHIVIHESCFPQLNKINFRCKTTFRESSSRLPKEPMTCRHHWVHRRKQEGKCKRCGKSFEKMFGFREPTKVIAISCSWCKEAYHNKVNCFHINKFDEPCSLGPLAKSIVPPTWIVKNTKHKSWRNRSKKRKSTGNTTKKRPTSKESKQKFFFIRHQIQQALFLTPLLVFINPKSGGRQGPKLLQNFRWHLNPRQVYDLSKENPQEAIERYRKVPNLRILACGGDGTVGWILSVLDKLNLSNPPAVGIVPLGTGNDLSRTLNFGSGYTDEGVPKIVQGVEEAKLVKLDRWKLTAISNEKATRNLDEDEVHNDTNCDGTNKLPLEVLNNYFSIGSDAQVSFNFHESREAHPARFTSRFGNKFYYARAGVEEFVRPKQSKNLFKHISVVCDGHDITPKIKELKPVCLLFLNIPRYSSGTLPWGHPTGGEFAPQSHEDMLIEVLAFSINQLGMLFVGGHGDRICQCKSATIETTKTFPVQIDGEPCKLNPSIINLEFFNQANMLLKCKRRPSLGFERQFSQEQIKIRINLIKSDVYDTFKGKKEQLEKSAVPLLVTVAKSHSNLETVRSCLLISFNGHEHAPLEKWVFLDSTSRDKLYKIDKNQENRLILNEVISGDREVYILNIPSHYSKYNDADKHRNRVKSDSSMMHSISSSSSNVSKFDYSPENLNLMTALDDTSKVDPTSSYLDVVFEQPEGSSTRVSSSNFEDVASDHSHRSDVSATTVEQKLPTKSSTNILPPFHPGKSQSQITSFDDSSLVNCASSSVPNSEFSLCNEDVKKSESDSVAAAAAAAASKTFKPQEDTSADVKKLESKEEKLITREPKEKNIVVANGRTPGINWHKVLLDSSKRGDCDKVKDAIAHGASASDRDEEGCTALHHAVRFSHEAVVDYLLEQDSDVVDQVCSERKQTALHKAAWYGRIDICRKLIAAGACLDVLDYKGLTPIDRAREAEDNDLVNFLIEINESRKTSKPFHETDL